MHARHLNSDLSTGYLCGRVRAKFKHNNIASTGNYFVSHIQMDVRNGTHKNKQDITRPNNS